MNSIFMQKPKLLELIPKGYIDIHSHLLPGIDDGTKTMKETENILNCLMNLGFSGCISTPHINPGVWNNNHNIIKEKYQQTLKSINIAEQILLHPASEYMLNDSFTKILDCDSLMTIMDNYVLIELSYVNPPLALNEIIFEIQQKGYQPILAHPERYTYYHHHPSKYYQLKSAGVLFQLNLLSTTGYYGKEVAKMANLLLKNEKIDFVGSDIHHQGHLEAFQKKLVITSIKQLQIAISKNAIFSNKK